MNPNNIQAVILAGGKGTRLKPLTNSIPKPMVLIENKPFLEILLMLLQKNNFKKILLLVGHLSDIISNYFGDGSEIGIKLEYSREKELLGTGGGLKHAYDMLDENFILLNGDTYLDLDFHSFLQFSKQMKSLMTMTVYDGPIFDNTPFNLKVDEDNLIDEFSQYPKERYNAVNTGIYYINKSLLDFIPSGMSSLEQEVIPTLVKEKKVSAFRTKQRFFDIGTFERLHKFQKI
jgi:NDP-sugar pyrophosphorylase family protein